MDIEGWTVVVFLVVMVLFVIGVGIGCSVQEHRLVEQCRAAGYDGIMRGDGDYCYRIVDGHRVLTPLVLVPEVKR